MNLTLNIASIDDARQAQALLRAYIVTQESAPKEVSAESAQELPFHALLLGGRASNCLIAEGITTVNALCRQTATDLLRLSNLGAGTLAEIRNALAAKGLTLAGE